MRAPGPVPGSTEVVTCLQQLSAAVFLTSAVPTHAKSLCRKELPATQKWCEMGHKGCLGRTLPLTRGSSNDGCRAASALTVDASPSSAAPPGWRDQRSLP